MKVTKTNFFARRLLSLFLALTISVLISFYHSFPVTSSSPSPPFVIDNYIESLDSGDVISALTFLHNDLAEDYETYLNVNNCAHSKTSLYNYDSVSVYSFESIVDPGIFSLGVDYNQYTGYENFNWWEFILDVRTYNDDDYLKSGKNRFIFLVGEKDNCHKILLTLRDSLYIHSEDNHLSLLASDTPVSSPNGSVWANPTNIRVGIFSNGSYVSTVSTTFKQYCYNVTFNEFGTNGLNQEARKASAMAIKNFGWHRIVVQNYNGYDVKSTEQVYKESSNTSITDSVKSAVNSIWNYIMLTDSYKLFLACYRTNSASNHLACQHGGLLSHYEANQLGNSGKDWQYILHYFYDYGTYGNMFENKAIRIVNLNHTPQETGGYSTSLLYHWRTCSTCGCYHKTSHTWISWNSRYKCSVCGYIATSIPELASL